MAARREPPARRDPREPPPLDEDIDLTKYDIIPATQRPDGTWRAPKKVKKGYVPPDEQEKFQTKGTKFRAQQVPGLVPGMDPDDLVDAKAKAKSKNKKKNENKQKKKLEDASGAASATAAGDEGSSAATSSTPAATAEAAPEDPKEAIAKKVRNLKKKVKQTDELQSKIASGEITPNAEQQEKLSKRAELEGEIKTLEQEMAKLST
eukprot:CAMPEP_0181307208 /NCGR_PEP_ID=MMETSP1101-20121128/10746_1 /TAXON_ID=46948 /ORGANISM="Rhodomonas abbreviata, Strain Caron Lab Isolate" /LENGTH=205 /DNA_ID=CAMNT_0023413387 /DNA_START=10 /DNA_END=627 /DNA_ORIENTATION=+